MEQAVPQAQRAGDHSEFLSRATAFDDGAGHVMKAAGHVAIIQEPIRVNLAGVTGGDTNGGLAF